tara:strand:- start:281 stop:484 length:204 start_codon:yes stop_codon:yes gene_type:complete
MLHHTPSYLLHHQVPGVNQVIRGKTLSLTGVRPLPPHGWASGEYKYESSAYLCAATDAAAQPATPGL